MAKKTATKSAATKSAAKAKPETRVAAKNKSKKAAPVKAKTKKAESNKGAPIKVGPNKGAPNKGAPNKVGLNKSGPNKVGLNKSGPNKGAPSKAAPVKAKAQRAAPKKAAPKKASPMKAAPKKASPKKASPKKASPMKAAPKKASPNKAAPAKPKKPVIVKTKVAPGPTDQASLFELAGKAMIIQIVGDAEAYFFDFMQLDTARKQELIAHHLAAFDRRKQAEGKPDWPNAFIPVALLGESMPPTVRQQFDLSAPHEGVLLHHPQSGALLYAASKDADKLAIIAPDLETLSPHPSFVADRFDPQTYAYDVDRTESEGFTLGQIELMMQVAGAAMIMI